MARCRLFVFLSLFLSLLSVTAQAPVRYVRINPGLKAATSDTFYIKGRIFQIEEGKIAPNLRWYVHYRPDSRNHVRYIPTQQGFWPDLWNRWVEVPFAHPDYSKFRLHREAREKAAATFLDYLHLQGFLVHDVFVEDYLMRLLRRIYDVEQVNYLPGQLTAKVVRLDRPWIAYFENDVILVSTGLLTAVQTEDELLALVARAVGQGVLNHAMLNTALQGQDVYKISYQIPDVPLLDFKKLPYNVLSWPSPAQPGYYLAVFDAEQRVRLNRAQQVFGQLSPATSGFEASEVRNMIADRIAMAVLKRLNADTSALTRYFDRTNAIATENEDPQSQGLTSPISRLDSAERNVYSINMARIMGLHAWDCYYQQNYESALSVLSRLEQAGVQGPADLLLRTRLIRMRNYRPAAAFAAREILKQAPYESSPISLELLIEGALLAYRVGDYAEAKVHLQNLESTLAQTRAQFPALDYLARTTLWAQEMILKCNAWEKLENK